MKAWIQSRTDRAVWPLGLRPEMVDIIDIAHALSNICRFTGHVHTFYSVAQHCFHISQVVPPEAALAGLLHDAAEAYLGDSAAPLKRHTCFHLNGQAVPFAEVERQCHAVICTALGVSSDIPGAVKIADLRMLMTEKEQLLGPSPLPWAINAEPYPDMLLEPMPPKEACRAFLARYMALTI